MFFSIIIPIHNSEKYLRQCIDSILTQTCRDFEVILVNDGSKDDSPRICDQYCDEDTRFHVIHRKQGKGAASARNAGTNMASGEYIVYIDSDDYIEDAMLLADIKKQAEKGYDVICYKFRKYFEDTDEMAACTFSMPAPIEGETIGDYVNRLVKCDAFYCAPWTKAIRRKILVDGGVKFKEGLLSEDQEWYYHVLIGANSIIGIDKSYIIYRQHKSSTSVSWTMKNLTDTIRIIMFWKKEIERTNLPDGYKNALLNSIAKLYCNLLIGYTRYSNTDKKNEYNNLKKLAGLMDYHINPRVNTFYKVYKVGGFTALMMVLKIICKLR